MIYILTIILPRSRITCSFIVHLHFFIFFICCHCCWKILLEVLSQQYALDKNTSRCRNVMLNAICWIKIRFILTAITLSQYSQCLSALTYLYWKRVDVCIHNLNSRVVYILGLCASISCMNRSGWLVTPGSLSCIMNTLAWERCHVRVIGCLHVYVLLF